MCPAEWSPVDRPGVPRVAEATETQSEVQVGKGRSLSPEGGRAWQGGKKEKSPWGSELSLVGSLGQGQALTLGRDPARYPSRDSGWSFPD